MANNFITGTAELGGDLAYDLRQTYAKIVGDHLEDIAQARKADNYSIYFKTLKDLFIIVKHKIKNKKVMIIKKDGERQEKTEVQIFNSLIETAAKAANKHPQEWLGQSKNPEACSEIEITLNAMETFLYAKIDEAKMFGGSDRTPGL